MNVKDLLQHVASRGGDVSAIFLGDGNPEDRYAIVDENGVWKVFYSERGERFELRVCAGEAAACDYLLELLERDKTVWHGR